MLVARQVGGDGFWGFGLDAASGALRGVLRVLRGCCGGAAWAVRAIAEP
jgi:hypothetical protein